MKSEYPKFIYHPEHGAKIVHSKEIHEKHSDWAEEPAGKPAADVKGPFSEEPPGTKEDEKPKRVRAKKV